MTTTSRLLGPDGVLLAPMAERRTEQTQDPQRARVPYRARTPAGPVITPDHALTISAVWACHRYLTQSVAKLPWHVRRRTGTNSEVVRRHPVENLVSFRMCPECSSFQFRETLLSWALRWGNGYAEIERAADGRVVAMWPLEPWRTDVLRDRSTGAIYYEYYGDGGRVQLDPMDVFHLRGFGEAPVGLSVMAYAAQSLGWVKAAQVFGAAFFGNGAQLSGVVSMKKLLSPEALGELRREFQQLYGRAGANSVAFLDNEMTYQSIGVEPEKGQFVETQQHLIDEVCRWFGVPPHKIYHLLRATFSNIEHQSIEVVEDSLRPWAKRFEDEADFKLFGQNRSSLYTRMDFTELLRADTTTRMAYYQGMRNIGALSADEIRDAEGQNEIGEEGGGKKYTLQSGMTTLERIGEDAPVTPATEPAPTADPASQPDPPGDPLDPAARRVLGMRNRVGAALGIWEFGGEDDDDADGVQDEREETPTEA